MSFPHSWLMIVALALATAAIAWLLRPPARRLVVSYLPLWRRAAAEAGRRPMRRRWDLWLILSAAGGLLLAGSVGGWALAGRRATPPPVLVLVADSPQLLACDMEGNPQADRLVQRLGELAGTLAADTPVRVVVISGPAASFPAPVWGSGLRLNAGGGKIRDLTASQLSGRIQAMRRQLTGAAFDRSGSVPAVEMIDTYRWPDDGMVYLLGQFRDVPVGDRVQWVFRPAPPARDIGIVSAGAERTDAGVHIFAAVRRFAGSAAGAELTVRGLGPAGQPLAIMSCDLATTTRSGAVAVLPPDLDEPIELRLAGADDQPANDALLLLPPTAGDVRATVQLVGRPNERILQAIAGSDRLVERSPGLGSRGRVDWLIVNEVADPVIVAPGQFQVVVDPLVGPPGARIGGPLHEVIVGGVGRAAREPPWDFPMADIRVARARQVRLDSRWSVVAADSQGHPLIAYAAEMRQLAIFFSLAADNTNWPRLVSWPLFWDALGSDAFFASFAEEAPAPLSPPRALPADRSSGPKQEQKGHTTVFRVARPAPIAEPGRTVMFPFVVEEDAFVAATVDQAAAVNQAAVRAPPLADRPIRHALWPWLALLGAALLAAGWLLLARRVSPP